MTPDNVLLTVDGSAKLLDFGLVRASGDAAATPPGTVVGTPRHRSPEQALDTAVDSRADIFGVGAVLYHAVTGTLPFPGGDTLAVLSALAIHTPTPADRTNPAVPWRLGPQRHRVRLDAGDHRPLKRYGHQR